jgi:DNA-directed RNA polymerase subunit N (RpoN/RPB10)
MIAESMSSKEKALHDLDQRDQHFWDVVARDDNATISVADTADALGISKYCLRKVMASGTLDIGATIQSPNGRIDTVILRSKLIRYYTK